MRQILGIVLVLGLLAGCSDKSKDSLLTLDQVPAPLVKIAQEQLPDVKFDHARKRPNGDYEIRGKGPQGKVREVELTPEGKVVEIE
jgi:hypothetical protein